MSNYNTGITRQERAGRGTTRQGLHDRNARRATPTRQGLERAQKRSRLHREKMERPDDRGRDGGRGGGRGHGRGRARAVARGREGRADARGGARRGGGQDTVPAVGTSVPSWRRKERTESEGARRGGRARGHGRGGATTEHAERPRAPDRAPRAPRGRRSRWDDEKPEAGWPKYDKQYHYMRGGSGARPADRPGEWNDGRKRREARAERGHDVQQRPSQRSKLPADDKDRAGGANDDSDRKRLLRIGPRKQTSLPAWFTQEPKGAAPPAETAAVEPAAECGDATTMSSDDAGRETRGGGAAPRKQPRHDSQRPAQKFRKRQAVASGPSRPYQPTPGSGFSQLKVTKGKVPPGRKQAQKKTVAALKELHGWLVESAERRGGEPGWSRA